MGLPGIHTLFLTRWQNQGQTVNHVALALEGLSLAKHFLAFGSHEQGLHMVKMELNQ